MGTLKYFSLISLSFLLLSCKRISYEKSDESFCFIVLDKWNSSVCPKKVVFERYIKNSNFKNKISSDSDFVINCGDELHNQRIIFPSKKQFVGKINYDIRLIIDDSLEYKIIDIQNKIDTVFLGGRPGDLTIMNSVKSLIINNHRLDNSNNISGVFNVPIKASVFIPTKWGKSIKK